MKNNKKVFLFSLPLLVLLMLGSYIFFSHQQKRIDQLSSIDHQAFPSLSEQKKTSPLEIEEINGTKERIYILHGTLIEPLFYTHDLLKGTFFINGDPLKTQFYFTLGNKKKNIFLGTVKGHNSSWQNVTVEKIPTTIGEEKNVLVYIKFPEDLTTLDPASVAYLYAKQQQQHYLTIKSFFDEGTASHFGTDFTIEQLGYGL